MQTRKLIFPLLFLAAGLLTSCGGNEQAASVAESAETKSTVSTSSSPSSSGSDESSTQGDNLNVDVRKAMSDAMKKLNGGEEAKEVVDFRELKPLLPESIGGLERASHDGKKVGAMGMNLSTAQAQYKDGDETLAISIIDFAGVSYFLASSAAWATMEIDEESDTGYKRTTMIDGYKAFEEYDNQKKNGQVSIIAEDRFIITVEGRNIEEGALREALDAVSIDKLKGLQ